MSGKLPCVFALLLIPCLCWGQAPGDCDLDRRGAVDFADYLMLARNYSKRTGEEGFNKRLDLNKDGRVDRSDFTIFCRNYGKLNKLPEQSPPVVWQAYHGNPVISSDTHRSYYPNVVHNGRSFLMYTDYTYAEGEQVPVVSVSRDGVHFRDVARTEGLRSARHTKTIYEKRQFAGRRSYKVFYWDTSVSIYTPGAMRTAESGDGITWENDRPLTGDYVSGTSGTVNGGTYGPSTVFHNRKKRVLDHDNPLNNRFVMYYVATTGAEERNGIAYSLDGTQSHYGGIALEIGGTGEWDAKYASSATVVRNGDGTFDMWYSGGAEDSNDGIGHATSEDGLTFIRDPDNPILTTQSGTWHALRTYTPMVIPARRTLGVDRSSRVKPSLLMYVSGVDEDGVYSVGLYLGTAEPPHRRSAAADR